MKAMVQMFGWENKQDPSTCRQEKNVEEILGKSE
jgi:hypothetical protein